MLKVLKHVNLFRGLLIYERFAQFPHAYLLLDRYSILLKILYMYIFIIL